MNPVTAAPETVSTSGSRTLVLNAGYEPLSVVSFRRALVLVMNGRAIMVEGDDAHPVRSVEGTWERPSVIVLTRYVKMPHNRHIPVSRRGVWACFGLERRGKAPRAGGPSPPPQPPQKPKSLLNVEKQAYVRLLFYV